MSGLTLEDIARQAGVSRSTVSRVVNGHPGVREDVRRRVLGVVQATGYHPNAAARTLASQRSRMIGLVLPRTVSALFTDPYFPHLTHGIAQACNQADYTLGVFLVSSKDDEEKVFPRLARRGYLDGLLVQTGRIGDQLIERLVSSHMPLVILGRPFHTQGVSYIDVDNVSAARHAVAHLLRLGYARIGTITGPADNTTGLDRLEGYRKALAERGHSVDEALVCEGDFSEASGYYAMRQMLPARPTAVFAASDIMAIGALRAIREAGLRVPGDIALVGFDDLPLASRAEPPLTTVRQQVVPFGMAAVDVLIDLIENDLTPPRRVIMDAELIIRESCGAHHRR
jgi:LacI family transcriptional regulator